MMQVMQKMWVQSLGQEDPLEEGMATHSSILAWRIPWTEVPGGLQSMGAHRVGHSRLTLESGLVSRGSKGLCSPLESDGYLLEPTE